MYECKVNSMGNDEIKAGKSAVIFMRGLVTVTHPVTFGNRQFDSQTQFMQQLTRCAKVRK